jgi:deazaflavin-dependent oxidoreductase (nitroreductase family)
MPLPHAIAHLNKLTINRMTVKVAPAAPGFGVITHHGRRTGKVFHTPVKVFPQTGQFVIPLTYGTRCDWVKNVRAAGGCDLRMQLRDVRLVNPRLVRDKSRAGIRPIERVMLHFLWVSDFLVLEPAELPNGR